MLDTLACACIPGCGGWAPVLSAGVALLDELHPSPQHQQKEQEALSDILSRIPCGVVPQCDDGAVRYVYDLGSSGTSHRHIVECTPQDVHALPVCAHCCVRRHEHTTVCLAGMQSGIFVSM